MKLKYLIGIFVFILVFGTVNAAKRGTNVFLEEDFDNCANWSLGFRMGCNDGFLYGNTFGTNPANASDTNATAIYLNNLPNLSTSSNNFSCTWSTNQSLTGTGGKLSMWWATQKDYSTPFETYSMSSTYCTDNAEFVCAAETNKGQGFKSDVFRWNGRTGFTNITWKFYLNNSAEIYENITQKAYIPDIGNSTPKNNMSTLIFGTRDAGFTSGYDFVYCYNGTTLLTNTLNISIFVEGTNNLLTPNSVRLDFDSVSNVVNYSTTTGNLYLQNLPDSQYTITSSTSGFTTRRYLQTIASGSYQINIYLLNSTSATDITFIVKDKINSQTINDAAINVYGKVGTTEVLVDYGKTNIDGSVILPLDTSKTYRFVIEAEGYSTNTFSMIPNTATSYNILIDPLSSIKSDSLSQGITYYFEPRNIPLNNDTDYNFTYNMTSTFWNITNCVFTLKNGSGYLAQNSSSFNSSMCSILIQFNTGNQSKLIASVDYRLNNSFNVTNFVQYSIRYVYQGTFSLKTAINDISNFSGAGFNNKTKLLIAFLLTFLVVGLVSATDFAGLNNPISLLILTFLIVFIFSYVGWFNIDYPFPEVGGSNLFLQQYIISILMFCGIAGYISYKHQ